MVLRNIEELMVLQLQCHFVQFMSVLPLDTYWLAGKWQTREANGGKGLVGLQLCTENSIVGSNQPHTSSPSHLMLG